MNHQTDYNDRLQQVRARKQARRELIARVAAEFGLHAAHDLLLEAATDVEDLLLSGQSGAKAAVTAPAAVPETVAAAKPAAAKPAAKPAAAKPTSAPAALAAPAVAKPAAAKPAAAKPAAAKPAAAKPAAAKPAAAKPVAAKPAAAKPAAAKPAPAKPAPAKPAEPEKPAAGRKGKASAPAAPAPAPAPVIEAKEEPVVGGGGSMSALVLGALKDAAPRKLTAPDILKAINATRPEIERGQVFETLTRLVKKRDTPLIRKGVAGKFRYTIRIEEAPAPAPSASAEPRPKATNNARVLEALGDVGPTTDSARLARVAFGETTTETKQKVRNALHSLLSSGKIHRREDGTWEAVASS